MIQLDSQIYIIHERNWRSSVPYRGKNDCLRTEVAKLFSTKIFPTTFSFAEGAFGTGPPEAINLWIGNERSVSSMHKDHYENLFYVCSGQKEFVLCPPADAPFLHENLFATGTFCPIQSSSEDQHGPSWVVIADDRQDDDEDKSYKTKWIEPDILKHSEHGDRKFPLLKRAHPIKILLSEGEMLYIPSLWYHRVTQTCETVGVNYWFDMKFDGPNWCYFKFMQNCEVSISKN
jgi:jumonji domain-containing protein 7